MALTYTQALERLREDRLDEPTARQWTNETLFRFLHDGAKDVARKSETLQDTATITCSDGVQEYDLPDDMVRVYRVVWTADGDTASNVLEFRDFNNADAVWWTQQAITQGTPQIFTMWGVPGAVKAVLYPTPATDGELTVQYYRLPAALPSSPGPQVLEIPEGWEDVVLAYAEYRALRQDRDPRWQEAKAEYDEQLSALMTMTRRYTDQSGQVIQGGYSQVNGWLYEFD